jgi:tetratricopeptide (TPR) repeat protein
MFVGLLSGFLLDKAFVKAAEDETMRTFDLTQEGSKLSENEAADLEKKSAATPDDLSLRIKLVSYYNGKYGSETARKNRQQHILWIIKNHPDVMGLDSEIFLVPELDNPAFEQAKKLWLEQVKKNPKNIKILRNAAQFFYQDDKDDAEKLINRAMELEPKSYEWPAELGHLYHLCWIGAKKTEEKIKFAKLSFQQYEKALKLDIDEIHESYLLPDIAKAAFESGDSKNAKDYCERMLREVETFKKEGNYGSVIHDGNMVLGRIALKSGDIKNAKEYLIKAGNTPGGPVLGSFGPNLSLAKELLKKGEKDTVVKYFQLCLKFWKLGKNDLNKWIAMIKKGETPDFMGHFSY